MRGARPGLLRHKTLRAQADVSHTFASLLIPLTLILVGLGCFQLNRALAKPLESDVVAVLFGSVLLAWGLLLGIYLLRAFRVARARSEALEQEVESSAAQNSRSHTRIVSRGTPTPRQFHGHYVDGARISR